jgi:hypothetical protein
MERNLLEREIAALRGTENFFAFTPWFATPKIAVPTVFQTKLRGKVTEPSFLRQADLKTREKTNGKYIYYLPNQWVDILGDNGEWFLVEGTAAFMDGRKETPYPTTIQGWIKKDWVIYKIPPKLDEEPKAGMAQINGYTCYVEIDLKITDRRYRYYDSSRKAQTGTAAAAPPKMTAIYVPQNFKPADETDMIIYLHGWLDGIPHFINLDGTPYKNTNVKPYIPPIQYYLNYSSPNTQRYFNFREIINQSGKSVVFVAPTLGGKSQPGKLAENFDNYVDQVIWAINEHIYKARNLNGQFKLRNLILAAHSGGGSPMLGIAEQSKSTYVSRIKSYWGFDSWVSDPSRWNTIANNPAISIYAYHYSHNNVPDRKKSTVSIIPPPLPPNYNVVPQKGKHFIQLPVDFKQRVDAL